MKINSRIPSLQEWNKEHSANRNHGIPENRYKENYSSQQKKQNIAVTVSGRLSQKLSDKIFEQVDSFFGDVQKGREKSNRVSKVGKKDLNAGTLLINYLEGHFKRNAAGYIHEKQKEMKPAEYSHSEQIKPGITPKPSGKNEKEKTKSRSIVYYFFDFNLYKILRMKCKLGLPDVINRVVYTCQKAAKGLKQYSVKVDNLIFNMMEKIAGKVAAGNSEQYRADIF